MPRVSTTQNQEGTIKMRDEVLSSVGAQNLEARSYQVSDLEDIEFNWEKSQLDMDAVFRPGIDNHFSLTTFDDFQMGSAAAKPITVGDEEDKNTPPPSTPESVRPTEPPRLQKNCPFGTRSENVPDYVFRNLFQ